MDQTETTDSGGRPMAENDVTTLDPDLESPVALADFQAELARAMQAAAERERKRIARAVSDEAAGQAEATRTRAAIEAEELRRLAEADLERIQEWSAEEVERIRVEAQRRTVERRTALETYLAQHEAIIDAEIGGLDGAVSAHEAIVADFFDRLRGMTDPGEIARIAASLPPPPDLDAARASARSRAIADVSAAPDAGEDQAPSDGDAQPDGGPSDSDAAVGVMDPEAIGRAEVPTETGEAGVIAGDEALDASNDPTTAAAESIHHESAAARVLRTIAPWAASSNGSPERNGSTD